MKGEVKNINGKRIATTEYRSWQMMKNRCQNRNAVDYARYGGRGITFVRQWQFFENFLHDMGRKPNPKMTLERVDNDKGYSKENCTWATRECQSRNRGNYLKLSVEKADEIRKHYATGKFFQFELAAMYKTNQSHISQIVRNVCWKGGGR